MRDLGEQLNMKDIKLVAFDLDDTLAESKAPIEHRMSRALHSLLSGYEVLIISGGTFEQFERQVLAFMPHDTSLCRLHLMPTCGTRYLKWHSAAWIEEYSHNLTAEVKADIIAAVEHESRRLGYWADGRELWGDRIEDRGSQITYSALGQRAPVATKKAWDPTGVKRSNLQEAIQRYLPELEVRAGGSTSIDITEKGIDKAHGLGELMGRLSLSPNEVLFVGDRLEPGGNDFPVTRLSVRIHAVSNPSETVELIRSILATSRDVSAGI